jgi:hypothetical protein
MLASRRALMSLRARRLNRLREAGVDERRRRWLLAIAILVGVATGDPSAASSLLADSAMAELSSAA